MKKTLLTLAIMLLGLGAASAAEDVTFSFSTTNNYGLPNDGETYIKDATEAKNGDVTLTLSRTGSGNGFRIWSDGLRLYKTNTNGSATIAITVNKENAVVTAITMTTGGSIPTVEIDNQTITYSSATKTYSWTGKATSPSIVLKKPSGSAVAISSLKITYEIENPDDTRADAEIKFPEASYIVDEGSEFTAPEPTKATTAALTYTSSNTEVATVNVTTGAVTIVAPGSTVITASAAENTEFKAGESSYTIDVAKVVNSIAETKAVTDKTLKLRINYPLTVGYKNGNNTFACNGDDFIQVYGTQPGYKVGDIIPAGWIGNYDLFKSTTPEILNPIGIQAATENNGFTPEKANYADITVADVNKILMLENVVFAEATPSDQTNFTGTVGETSVSLRNNYTLPSVEAGTYNVSVVVTIYNNAPSLYVTNYEKVDDTTGIADIVADENAPVEYFNLQGIRVDNPENGLYIRRQGNKVTKVIVK